MNKKISFSPKQQEALDLTKQNMLVSAGAGSGKTAVLVERLYRILTVKDVPLDRVLVLTFTKAGAEEFKNRIKVRLQNDPRHAHKAFAIDNADITTFDAYALKVIKKYGYMLDIESNPTNLSEAIEQILFKRSFNEVMHELYESPTSEFTLIAKRLLIKDDDNLFSSIMALHNKAKLTNDPYLFADNVINNVYTNENFEAMHKEFTLLVISVIREIAAVVKTLSDERHVKLYDKYFDIYGSILTFDQFMSKVDSLSKPSLPRGSAKDYPEDEAKNKLLKDLYKTLIDFTRFESTDAMYRTFQQDKEYAKFIIPLYKQIMSKVDSFKDDKNAYTFNDIARLAYKLVSLPEISEELRKNYEYILIDEYQDTSDIQEEFTSKIANDNVYMVGDIKQSIYAFRNANSDIFRAKYTRFKKKDGGVLVDLNDNYRSRPEVLDAINDILSTIMSERFGGANYKKDHIIGWGNKVFSTFNNPLQERGLKVINYEIPKPSKKGDDSKDELVATIPTLYLSPPEYEADLIIEDIKNKLDSRFEIFDGDQKRLRPVEYRDFTILISRSTHFDKVEQRFIKAGIPIFVAHDETVSNDLVLIAVKSLLKIFNGFQSSSQPTGFVFRHAVASFLRSFVNNYTDQQLFELMRDKNNDFSSDPILMKIKDIAQKTICLPVELIIEELFEVFDIFGAVFKVGDMTQNTIKLHAKMNELKELSNLGFNIEEIIAYYSDLESEEIETKVSRPKLVENAVNMMTIHHSKGLEFPIVYYMDLNQDFFRMDKSNKFRFDNHFGFILPEFGGKNSFAGILTDERNKESILSERIRLLYVALTRARELMVVVHPTLKENEEIPSLERSTTLRSLLLQNNLYKSSIIFREIAPQTIDQFEGLGTYLGKATINVSKLDNLFEVNKIPVSKSTLEFFDKEILRRGTLLHSYIEQYNFASKDLSYVVNNSDRQHLLQVLSLPIFENATNENVYREYEFIDESTGKTYSIDYFCLKANKITLIDFKLDNIDKAEYVLQVRNYAKHLQKAFGLKVEAYLLSILKLKFKEVIIDE